MCEDRLNQLRVATESTETLKALSHLDVISAAAIDLIANPTLFGSVTHSFLAEVSREDRPVEAEDAAVLLRQTIDMQAQIEPGRSLRFDSIARLRQRHDDLVRDHARWVEARIQSGQFPSPPVPGLAGVIEPLESAAALVLEGRAQSNCVASYWTRVVNGQVYVYRVLQPERATLSLVRGESGRWAIGELKASRNRAVTEDTVDLVEEWLTNWQFNLHG